jgi:hypothetical protein
VVVGHHLELVLLPAHVEPALGVDLFEDQLGGVLVRDAPRCGGARERRGDPELDDIGGVRASRRERGQHDGGAQHHVEEQDPLSHRAFLPGTDGT